MAKIEAVHPADYRDEMWHGSSAVTMRQMVFGMNDGLVATVGLVAGLTFAGSSQRLLLGATLAAITAAVVSMALGSFLSTRTEVHYQKAQMRREQSEIEHRPEEELEEMRQIYTGYGFSADEVAIFLNRFQQDQKLWLNLMLRDELGIIPETFESPWINAGQMALAVLAGSIPPLVPNILLTRPTLAFPWAIILAILTAFGLGAATGRITGRLWWRSGLSFLGVASVAAMIGMGAGAFIAPLFA